MSYPREHSKDSGPSPVNGSQFVSQSGILSTMQPGQTATVAITMKNTGSRTWTRDAEYKLGTHNPQDNTIWTGGTNVYLSETDAITPGQQRFSSSRSSHPLHPVITTSTGVAPNAS